MQKNLVLERSQKQYLIKSASGKDGNAGIDVAFIRTVHRNLLRLYRLYTFVFARGKRALEGADNAVAVVPIQSGTKRQSEQYALFFAMPAALYARNAAESGDKKAYDAYKLTPFSVCAVEDLQKLSQQLSNVRCRTQKDFAATMRVLCRAVVTLETPYQMTIDVQQEADLSSVLDNTGDFFLPEETPSPAFSLENNALPAPSGFQSAPKTSHPATIGGFAHHAAPARNLMGTIPAPAAPRTGGFAATVPFEGERVTPPQKKAEPVKETSSDAPTFVTDDVQPEAPEFDLTSVFPPTEAVGPNEFEPPVRTPDFKRAKAPEKKSAPRSKQTRISPFWIGHEAELAPKGRIIEAPGADYTLEESESARPSQKEPASFRPMATSTQKEPASFRPMATSTQKEPASFRPMATPSQKEPASFRPMATPSQKEPASFRPMATPSQKEPASFRPMVTPSQKKPASFRPTSKPAETEPEGVKTPNTVTYLEDELRAKPPVKNARPVESRDSLVLPVNVVDAFEDKKEKRPAEAPKKPEEDARPSVMAYRFDYFADHTAPERQIKSPFRMDTTEKEDTQAVRRIVREDAPAQPEKKKSEEASASEIREEAAFAAPEISTEPVFDAQLEAQTETTPETAASDVQATESDAPFFVTDIVTDPQPESDESKESEAAEPASESEGAPFLVTDIETFTPDAQDVIEEEKEEAPAQETIQESFVEPVVGTHSEESAEAAQTAFAEAAAETVDDTPSEEGSESDAVNDDEIDDNIVETADETTETEVEPADAGIAGEEIDESAVTAEAAETEDAGIAEEETAESAETAQTEEVGDAGEKADETADAEDAENVEEKGDAPISVPLYYTRDDRDAALDEELDEIFGELMRDTRHDTPEGELDEFLEELETSQDDSASRAPIPADRLADVLSLEESQEEAEAPTEPTIEAVEAEKEEAPAPTEPIDIDVDEPQTWQDAVADEAIRHAEQLHEGEKPRRMMFVPRILQTQPVEEEETDAPDLLPEDAAAPEPAEEDVLPGELPGEELSADETTPADSQEETAEETAETDNNIVETADETPAEDAVAAPRAPYAYDVEVLVADEVPPQEANRIVGDYERSRGQNVGDLWEQVQKHWDIAEPLRIADENEVRISPEKEAFIREQADAIADELAADEPIDTQHMRDAVNSDDAFAARSRALYDKLRIVTPVIPAQNVQQSAAPEESGNAAEVSEPADAVSELFDEWANDDFADDFASDSGEAFDADVENTADEAFEEDFDQTSDGTDEETAFEEEDAPVVPAALDSLYTPPAQDMDDEDAQMRELDSLIDGEEPEADEATCEEANEDETFAADNEGPSEEEAAQDAEANENVKDFEEDLAETPVAEAESADEIAAKEETEETAAQDDANADETEENDVTAADETETDGSEANETAVAEESETQDAEADAFEAAETELADEVMSKETEVEAESVDEDFGSGEGDDADEEPAALPPQDPFLAAGVPASGPMAALAASIRATQRQLEQEIARIRKRFAAISPEADEDETRAIFGRASIDEELPQSAEEEEAREIVLDAVDDEMNDTAVLDDLFEDAPAWDGADDSLEAETADEPARDDAWETAEADAVFAEPPTDAADVESADEETTEAVDVFGELFPEDAADEFVADANHSEDSAQDELPADDFPTIDDAAFEAIFGQKKTDAEEASDEAADDVFAAESADVFGGNVDEDAFAEDSVETETAETGFVLVNDTDGFESDSAAFAQDNAAFAETPVETRDAETGFVLVNGTEDSEPAEDAFAETSTQTETAETDFSWSDAVETDEDIFGQDADRAFGLGVEPKDAEADVLTEPDIKGSADDADAPVVAGAVFVPDASNDADTLADEDAAQAYGYEQVRTIEPIESLEEPDEPTLEDELAEAADDYAAQEAQIDALLYGDLPAVPDDVFSDDESAAEPSAEEAFETADLYDEGGAFAEEAFEAGADDAEAFDAFNENEPQLDFADEDAFGADQTFDDGENFEQESDFYDGLSDETDAVYGDGFVMLSQDEPSQTEDAPEGSEADEVDDEPAYDEAIYDEESYSDAYIAELDDVLSETTAPETDETPQEESSETSDDFDTDDFDDVDDSDDPLAEEQARLEREIAEQERLIAESRRNRQMLDELAAQLDRTIAQNTAAAAEAAREQVAREKFERTMRVPVQRTQEQAPAAPQSPAAFDEPAAQPAPAQDYRYGADDAPAQPTQMHRTQKKTARHRTKRWWR